MRRPYPVCCNWYLNQARAGAGMSPAVHMTQPGGVQSAGGEGFVRLSDPPRSITGPQTHTALSSELRTSRDCAADLFLSSFSENYREDNCSCELKPKRTETANEAQQIRKWFSWVAASVLHLAVHGRVQKCLVSSPSLPPPSPPNKS